MTWHLFSDTSACAEPPSMVEVVQCTFFIHAFSGLWSSSWMMGISPGPYDFGGILTNTNRDVVNGETVQKRNQAQKEMHWWEIQLVVVQMFEHPHNKTIFATWSLMAHRVGDMRVCCLVAFILVTCSLSPGSHSSSLWILQTALPTRYEVLRNWSINPTLGQWIISICSSWHIIIIMVIRFPLTSPMWWMLVRLDEKLMKPW